MDSRKLEIEFTEQFLLDFNSIFNYICFVLKNLYAARRLYSKLIYKLNQIRIFPEIYLVYATNNTNFMWRKMFVENYAVFEVKEEYVV